MNMNDNQHYYSEKSNGSSTSQVKADADKIQVSIVDKVQLSDEAKCPVCQEHHNIWGLTDAFDLYIKEDILFLKNKSARKDVFKIKYCPFCGRPFNEEENNGKSGDKKSTSGD